VRERERERERADLRRVNLLELGGDEHARDAHQLQLWARARVLGQAAVDEVDGEEERLRVQLVLLRHLHQPVHQDAAHGGVDVALHRRHVRGVRPVPHLATPREQTHVSMVLPLRLGAVRQARW
jgi:hypothetical protein